MKKLFLLFSFCFSLLYANGTIVDKNNSNISQIKTENVIHKNITQENDVDKIKKFIETPEFTTFCNEENLKNNSIRIVLNRLISMLKVLSTGNMLFGLLAFVIYIVVARFGFILIFIVLALSDLYYNNPLAIIGIPFDLIATGIKLFLGVFGIYLLNISALFIGGGVIIGVFILIGMIIESIENSKTKKTVSSLKNIFYVVAMADGNFSKKEKIYLKRIMYDFAKFANIDKQLAEYIGKKEANNASSDEINIYIKNLTPLFEKNKKIKNELLNALIEFSLIDGLNQEKKDILHDIADALDIDIDIDEFIAKQFSHQNNDSDNKLDDVYKILGVDKNVSCSELKKKYREAAKKYHPDKISSKDLDEEFVKFAEDMFKKVNNAYETLNKIKNCK